MTDMRASAEHRAANLPAYSIRADPHLIQLAKLGHSQLLLMRPSVLGT